MPARMVPEQPPKSRRPVSGSWIGQCTENVQNAASRSPADGLRLAFACTRIEYGIHLPRIACAFLSRQIVSGSDRTIEEKVFSENGLLRSHVGRALPAATGLQL